MLIMHRLQQLQIALPPASPPAAAYTNVVCSSGFLFVSGKGPHGTPRGKLGEAYTTADGYAFAREAGIELLAAIRDAGYLERIVQVVKLHAFVHATPEYDEHHLVFNGCSDLMVDVFGERGVHARSVCGAISLRGQLPVIVEGIFAIDRSPDNPFCPL